MVFLKKKIGSKLALVQILAPCHTERGDEVQCEKSQNIFRLIFSEKFKIRGVTHKSVSLSNKLNIRLGIVLQFTILYM